MGTLCVSSEKKTRMFDLGAHFTEYILLCDPFRSHHNIDNWLVQERRNPSALAME